MAQKRMFDKSVVSTDDFLEMPISTQNLYFHLSMNADDDGFVDKCKAIMKMCGASEDDMKVLIMKYYVIPFESGVIVIRHWKLNNFLRKDRHNATIYQEELSQLCVDSKNVYQLEENGQPNNGQPSYGQPRLDKNRIEKKEIENNKLFSKERKFVKPTVEEVEQYCLERKNNIDPRQFVDFYESKGWKVGNQPMKDWKACVRTWEKNHKNDNQFNQGLPRQELPTWFDNTASMEKIEDNNAIQEMEDLLKDFE